MVGRICGTGAFYVCYGREGKVLSCLFNIKTQGLVFGSCFGATNLSYLDRLRYFVYLMRIILHNCSVSFMMKLVDL